MAKASEKWVAAVKEQSEWELNRTPVWFEGVYKDRNFRYIGLNCQTCAGASLRLGMIAYRVDHNVDAAQAYFRRGADTVVELSRVIGRIREAKTAKQEIMSDTLKPSSFEEPMYVCLLAGRLDSATALSEAIIAPEVICAEQGDDIRARIVGATIRNDVEDFEKCIRNYEALAADEKNLEIYASICDAIVREDQPRLDRQFESAVQQFAERANNREMELAPIIYGGPVHNEVVFDFMAAGLAKLALWRGMRVDMESIYLPGEIVRAQIS